MTDATTDPRPLRHADGATPSIAAPFATSVIEGLIPHRWPFLLVDRIVEYEPAEKRIVGHQGRDRDRVVLPGPLPGPAGHARRDPGRGARPDDGRLRGEAAGVRRPDRAVRGHRRGPLQADRRAGRHAPARDHDGEAGQPVRQGPGRRLRRRRGRLRGPPHRSSSRPRGARDDPDRGAVRRPRQPRRARGGAQGDRAREAGRRARRRRPRAQRARTRTAPSTRCASSSPRARSSSRATPTSRSATSTTASAFPQLPGRRARRRSPSPPSGPTTSWATTSSTGSAACRPSAGCAPRDDPLVLVVHASPGSQTRGFDQALDANIIFERAAATDARVICVGPHPPARGPRPGLEGHRQRRLVRLRVRRRARPPRGRSSTSTRATSPRRSGAPSSTSSRSRTRSPPAACRATSTAPPRCAPGSSSDDLELARAAAARRRHRHGRGQGARPGRRDVLGRPRRRPLGRPRRSRLRPVAGRREDRRRGPGLRPVGRPRPQGHAADRPLHPVRARVRAPGDRRRRAARPPRRRDRGPHRRDRRLRAGRRVTRCSTTCW